MSELLIQDKSEIEKTRSVLRMVCVAERIARTKGMRLCCSFINEEIDWPGMWRELHELHAMYSELYLEFSFRMKCPN